MLREINHKLSRATFAAILATVTLPFIWWQNYQFIRDEQEE